jgi:transketolase
MNLDDSTNISSSNDFQLDITSSQVSNLESTITSLSGGVYNLDEVFSLRECVGNTLVELGVDNSQLVVLDSEVGNSTFTSLFGQEYPDRFVQCYIAEQNMISVAQGLSIAGKIPVAVTFGAFLMRAADQLRMAQYSAPRSNLKIIGTHCGVSIGADGPSQMALEDISFFRCIRGSVVLYPSDNISAKKLTELAINTYNPITYLRITRENLPNLYNSTHEFVIGGSKQVISHKSSRITIISAGITLHQAYQACLLLEQEGIDVDLIDLYSIKPMDTATLGTAYAKSDNILVVEDHYPEGGIYEAICSSGIAIKPTYSLAVNVIPRSGTPNELMAMVQIDTTSIMEKVRGIIS